MAKSASLALVGGQSLLAREMRDVLAGNVLGQDLKLVGAEDDDAGKLTELGGEPAIINPLTDASFESADIIFLAGSPESTRKTLELSPDAFLIDLTYAAEENPQARVRAPLAEKEAPGARTDVIEVIANAAAIALVMVLRPLHATLKVKRAVSVVFEPASERGAPAVDELHQQTVSLLSFKGQPRAIFDAQLAFNVLARLGDEAPIPLEDAEIRIERHLASLLAKSDHVPLPSLRLVQAPVFHGYSISLWVEFESTVTPEAIEQALQVEAIDVRADELEPPNAIGMAGEQGVAVGGIKTDRNNPRAAWLWVVTDNLRLRAENALAVAQQLL